MCSVFRNSFNVLVFARQSQQTFSRSRYDCFIDKSLLALLWLLMMIVMMMTTMLVLVMTFASLLQRPWCRNDDHGNAKLVLVSLVCWFYLTMTILASKLFFARDERLKSQAIMTVDADTGDVLVNQVSFTRVELIISNQIWIVLFLSKLTWHHTGGGGRRRHDDYIRYPGVDLFTVQLLLQPFLEPGSQYHILLHQCTSKVEWK